MLTLKKLKEFGADTENGLTRCMNNEAFYLRLIEKSLSDVTYEKLEEAVAAGDLKAAFEAAHGLKGVTANLALTPIHTPVAEMTELLRAGTMADYAPYLQTIREKREALKLLCEAD